ncbi:hypothetical protein K435DRAFT_861918 [Dendrothele bispora CBS 962.96]|uniref:Uncharacterized protein n=1 Tax=Dendrothele bispora (strain CBS 962.96) TaxID=1314807 RepID=A0A4S8LTW4_DENBC|nr:hypothetical protein K435DRAFT_861918 [Dendrothele bispora CBS 962.96]
MQSTTSLAAKRSCSSCSTHDHSLEGCSPISNNGATAWILANQPDVTSFQLTSNCTELVPYRPSPFPPLESKPIQGSTPIHPVTGALLGFNSIITHAFRDSILSQPLSDDQLMVFQDETGQTTHIFFSVKTADRIWTYSRDFNNLEQVQSDFSRLIPHITFAGSDNLLHSIFGSNWQSMQQIYTLIQFVAQKYALWIVQQKLARRRSEKAKLRKARSDEDVTMGLVLHRTASLPGQQGLLTPYTPDQPGWSIDTYAPSADIHMADEDFGK